METTCSRSVFFCAISTATQRPFPIDRSVGREPARGSFHLGRLTFDLRLLDLWRCLCIFFFSSCSAAQARRRSYHYSSDSLSMSCIAFSPLGRFLETFFSRTSYLSRVRSHSHVPGHTKLTVLWMALTLFLGL